VIRVRPVGSVPDANYTDKMSNRNRQESRGGDRDMPRCLGAIRMLCDVAQMCNSEASVRNIAGPALARVCQFNGWYAGKMHAVNSSGTMQQIAVEVTGDAPVKGRAALEHDGGGRRQQRGVGGVK